MAQDFLGLLRVTQTSYNLEVLVEGWSNGKAGNTGEYFVDLTGIQIQKTEMSVICY